MRGKKTAILGQSIFGDTSMLFAKSHKKPLMGDPRGGEYITVFYSKIHYRTPVQCHVGLKQTIKITRG